MIKMIDLSVHEEYLKTNYGTLSIQEMADELNLDYYRVRYMIKLLRDKGKVKSRSNKKWTPQEDEKLLEIYGHSTMEKMIDTFHRTEKAIIGRIKRLTGSEDKGYNSGYLTTTQLADIMGVTQCTVGRWIDDKDLKIHRVGARRYIINTKFWEWARKNTHWVDFRNYEYGSIGGEPRWLATAIEEQKKTFKPKPRAWTIKEVQALKFHVSCGRNDRWIAENILKDRSVGSIKRQRLRYREEIANES